MKPKNKQLVKIGKRNGLWFWICASGIGVAVMCHGIAMYYKVVGW